MKKLLLCTLITSVVLSGNLAAQKLSQKTSKTPALDALKQKQTTLFEKLNATDKQSKEYENITQELNDINKKSAEAKKSPTCKKVFDQRMEQIKLKNAEFKKIQNSNELKEIQKQSKDEIEQLMKEISQTDTKIKEKIDQLKELADKVKEIAKDKYKEEFKQIESYNPANINPLTFYSDPEENNFDKIVKSLAQKDAQIKELKKSLQKVDLKLLGAVFANKQYQEIGKKLAEKEKAVMYKLNPTIKKIDKKIAVLYKKLDMAMEKALVEMNKKEAATK